MKRPNLTALIFIIAIVLLQFFMGYLIGVLTNREAISFGLLFQAFEGLAPALILALGMALVVVYHGIDFSVAGIVSLTAVIVALVANARGNFFTGLLAALAVALVIGAINAAVISWLRMPSYITTLATWGASAHLAVLLSSGRTVALNPEVSYPGFSEWSSWGYFFLLFILLLPVLLYGALRMMVFRDRASVAGTFAAYLLSAYCAAVTGFVLLSHSGEAIHSMGDGRQWSAIAAVILGGVFLFRGGPAAIYGFITATLAVTTLLWFQAIGEALALTRDQIVGIRFLPPILCGFIYALAARVLFEFKPRSKPKQDIEAEGLPF